MLRAGKCGKNSNMKIFNEGRMDMDNLIREIKKKSKEFILSLDPNKKIDRAIQLIWIPPEWVMFYTGGREGSNSAPGVGVIKGVDGEWLAGYPLSLSFRHPVVMELMAAIRELKVAWSWGFNKSKLRLSRISWWEISLLDVRS